MSGADPRVFDKVPPVRYWPRDQFFRRVDNALNLDGGDTRLQKAWDRVKAELDKRTQDKPNGPGQASDQERHVEANRTDSIRLPEYSIGQTTSKWAEIFQCSPSTILRRIKKGELPAKPDGRKWRLRLDQLPAEYVQKAIQK